MTKFLIAMLILTGSATAFAGPNTVVSGNANAGSIHIFDTAAERIYQMLEDSGAQKEDLGGCVELRNNTMVCGQQQGAFSCTISIKAGEVSKADLPVCPRP